LNDGDCAEGDACREVHLRDAVDCSTDTTPLGDLFRKPNVSIVNKIDGSSEPNLSIVELYLNRPDFYRTHMSCFININFFIYEDRSSSKCPCRVTRW